MHEVKNLTLGAYTRCVPERAISIIASGDAKEIEDQPSTPTGRSDPPASLSICRPSGNSSGGGPASLMPIGVHIFWNGDHSAPIRRGGFALVRPFGQENEWNQGEDHHGHILKHPDQRHHGGLAFHQSK